MENFKIIKGGVCAAEGFTAAGIHCGIRKNKEKLDLAMVKSCCPANAAAVYTQNLVKGAPIVITKQNLDNGVAQAIIVNSGNANTCNADGEQKAIDMCQIAANVLGVKAEDVIVASTGVIGQVLDINPIKQKAQALADIMSTKGNDDAAAAIMTTDTFAKQFAVEFKVGDTVAKIGGMAKGSGMIHPNMATLLCFITTDCNISRQLLQKSLSEVTQDTYNMVSIDGDTSTNDTVAIMANGKAGNAEINAENDDYLTFKNALFAVMCELSRMIAKDGEGATKLLECNVSGAFDTANAKIIAKSVITSSLFKAAMFGADANWGRILCAIGYSGANLDINGVGVELLSDNGSFPVCANGAGVEFSEEFAAKVLAADEVKINITLKDGNAKATAWGCDLTYDYVKINGDYRT